MLTDVQLSFIHAYVACGRLDVACESANVDLNYGRELLNRPEIQEAIKSLSVEEVETFKTQYNQPKIMSKEEVLLALSRIAQGKPQTLDFNEEGVVNGKMVSKRIQKTQFPSPNAQICALELLGKSYQLFDNADENSMKQEETPVFVDDLKEGEAHETIE